MLVSQKVREAYWIMGYLTQTKNFFSAASLQKVKFAKDIRTITRVCNPLVAAGLLERSSGWQHVGYRLSRPACDITLAEIHRAYEPERYQEVSGIELYIDKCLSGKTLQDLVDYEIFDLKDLIETLRI